MGKNKNKRLCLGIFAIIMLLFVPVSAYASEIKSDGKTTQTMEEENKTVRVGYFPYANFQEGSSGEHKQGYSIDNEEIEVGLWCAAAPVFGSNGRVEAAVSVAGPTVRMLENKEKIVRTLLKVTRELSEKMGYTGRIYGK